MFCGRSPILVALGRNRLLLVSLRARSRPKPLSVVRVCRFGCQSFGRHPGPQRAPSWPWQWSALVTVMTFLELAYVRR